MQAKPLLLAPYWTIYENIIPSYIYATRVRAEFITSAHCVIIDSI